MAKQTVCDKCGQAVNREMPAWPRRRPALARNLDLVRICVQLWDDEFYWRDYCRGCASVITIMNTFPEGSR